MFYYLEGKTAIIEQNMAVIDCGGVGYAVNTTAHTLSRLKIGEKARVYTYVHVKEDAFDIFGFASLNEKHSFEMLLGVSGGREVLEEAIAYLTSVDFITAQEVKLHV